MKKIDLIVGARPNFIKAFPVYNALEDLGCFNLRLINTGQHYDKNMVEVFFEQLKMKKPDINLEVGSGKHGEQTARILVEIEKVLLDNRPDLVIVFGDVNSTVAAAFAAVKLNIKIAHVEAGLRSFDRTMPEEINRVLTDQISDLLFITSPEAEENLIREGKNKSHIYFVGNTMIDSLIRFQPHFDGINIRDIIDVNDKKFILITFHRPSNVDDPLKLTQLISALNETSEIIHCIWPIHPRIKNKMESLSVRISDRLIMTDPLGYLEFMALQKNSSAVITDSGGIQEESTFLGVPCFTVRDNTERPITIEQGTNCLIGTKYSKIPIVVKQAIDEKRKINIPELWDGNASERIAEIVLNKLI